MTELEIPGTFYVPDGEVYHVRFPKLREGNDEGKVFLTDDKGSLLALCYIDEADSDGLLLLKQYDASAIIEAVKAASKYGDIDPSGTTWRIDRRDGGLEVDPVLDDIESADGAM